MRISISILPVVAAGLLLTACGTTSGERIGSGALIGAGAGALVDGGTGAIIGGVGGAAVGAAVDSNAKDHGR